MLHELPLYAFLHARSAVPPCRQQVANPGFFQQGTQVRDRALSPERWCDRCERYKPPRYGAYDRMRLLESVRSQRSSAGATGLTLWSIPTSLITRPMVA